MANRVRHSSGSPGAGGIFRRALFDRETRSGHRGNSGRSVPPRRGEQNESEGRAAVRVGSSGEVHGLRYVWVPPGKFTMGCSAGDSDCGGYEKPAHQVTITKGFWLGQTEVTQTPYQRVVGTNSSYFKGADLPVEEVSWDQAQAYCQAIGGRLPTEAEGNMRRGREACRAGTAISTASRGYYGNSGGHTHDVAQKEANAWGVYDMLGNVWEWTADWYGGYAPGSAVDPAGPVSGQSRALRGGAWNNGPRYARVSYRSRLEPGNRNNNIGLRCAADAGNACQTGKRREPDGITVPPGVPARFRALVPASRASGAPNINLLPALW